MTVMVCLISITSATIWKVNQHHLAKKIKVVEKKITEAAFTCYTLDDCQGDTVTLDTLIAKGYLTKEINPKTKTYYDGSSYVKIENNDYIFIES